MSFNPYPGHGSVVFRAFPGYLHTDIQRNYWMTGSSKPKLREHSTFDIRMLRHMTFDIRMLSHTTFDFRDTKS